MSFRKAIQTREMNTVVFGIDKVTGVFLQFEELNGGIVNFSEYSPFNKRLTAENIQAAIKANEILKSDFEEVCQQELGDFKVYFRGIMATEDVGEDFELPKRLAKHYASGNGFKVKTVADYMRLLKLFKSPIVYSEVQWYLNLKKSSSQQYRFFNDVVFEITA